MTITKDPYMKVTRSSILRKVGRVKNPPTSLVALAGEFGINTGFTRHDGSVGNSAPPKFRSAVKAEVGSRVYKQIRDNDQVRS